jgi:phosphocarrier protein
LIVADQRTERTLKICNRLGMHARAAVKFVQLANRFRSEVSVSKDGSSVNGKSIMGILTLVAACGKQITVSAEGPDSEEAVDSLAALVADGFGEGVVDA